MRTWWHNLPLHFKLHLAIQLTLLVSLPLAHMLVMGKFEAKMLEDVRVRTQESATQSLLALNSMMLSGTIGNPEVRSVFFKKMSAQHGVEDFHLVRTEAVRKQFGSGLEVEWPGDELDQLAAKSNAVQSSFNLRDRKLRVVTPFAAQREYYGTNCLDCHKVPEGTTLGTVSLTVNLEKEYKKMERFSDVLIVGQIMLQFILFFIIGGLIRSITRSVSDLVAVMQLAQDTGNFSMCANVGGTDEVGQIARAFNRFMAHIQELYQKLAEKITALESYYDQTEEELRIGSDIMTRITSAHSTQDPAVRLKIDPAAHYSGDLILVARTPSGNLHIMLADAVGHGLIAAMNLLPLSQIFNAMSKKGFSVSRIAEELNSKIHRLMPVDRFIGAALVSVDFREQALEVWNGGVPAPLLIGKDGELLHQWKSRYLPLGILDEKSFAAEVEVFHFEEDCQLFLFSDGLPEAESPDGAQFGRERIVSLLREAAPSYRFDMLMRALEKHLAGSRAHDDVSIALVNITQQQAQQAHEHHASVVEEKVDTNSPWRVAVTLGADELKYVDAVPLLMQMVTRLHVTSEHHSSLYVILSELFNNALDHGVLGLDSAVKHGPDGFELYLAQRDERLTRLERASITIEMESVEIDGRPGVKIRVADSGEGFDVSALQANALAESGQHGRGIALARSLADKLEFGPRGNEAIAYYVCA
ncbi:MAG TPA: SpoIIE family protein phosphatase [Sideroxyarcus sp.]|nr:SpoIIE family protein phosphatase [Sideroxyarcus sp.]